MRVPLTAVLALALALTACGSNDEVAGDSEPPETVGTADSGTPESTDTTTIGEATGTTATTETRETARTTETTETTETEVLSLVLASPEGVVVVSGEDEVTVSTAPAAAAYGTDPDLVVFQDAEPGMVYPPRPTGPVRLWSDGDVRSVPANPDATRTQLLDAGVVGGVPVALITERISGAGPRDGFEDLVRVDLRDESRTIVARRPASESGLDAARLLREGDVIGLMNSEAALLLARLSPNEEDALWTVQVGRDTHLDLAPLGSDVFTVEPSFDEERDFAPVLTVTMHDPTTGKRLQSETIDIQDPRGEIGSGLFCRDWLTPTDLVCGRGDGDPVTVSTKDGSFAVLSSGVSGAIPTVIG